MKELEQRIDLARSEFDAVFYKRANDDIASKIKDPFRHFMKYGCEQGRDPRADFSCEFYLSRYGDLIGEENPFVHWCAEGREKGFIGHPWICTPALDGVELMRAEFDREFYLEQNPDVAKANTGPFRHFLRYGWREQRDPNRHFSIRDYVRSNKELVDANLNPFLHYVLFAKSAKAAPIEIKSAPRETEPNDARQVQRAHQSFDYSVIQPVFDETYYSSLIGGDLQGHEDLIWHYLLKGWRDGLDPTRWFSTKFYLERNLDVASANICPFVHYMTEGMKEGRWPLPANTNSETVVIASGAFTEHQRFTTRGPLAEEFDPNITKLKAQRAKLIAYYLPQFHAIPENDAWWGKGFTEWRNVSRGKSRFRDHFQPRIPEELGFYDLSDLNVMRRQCELAKGAGVHAFCFYYYWFNGKKVLDKPLKMLRAAEDIDMPFLIMWANENWTRTWDGHEKDVLLRQSYSIEDEPKLIADIADQFSDPRYVKIGDRPLFVLYRPGIVPEARETIARWRTLFRENHGVDPLIFMVQAFNDNDPEVYGLDGALEFPPHKVAADLPNINRKLTVFDPSFKGHVISYEDVVEQAVSEPAPSFPLIKAVTPSWDNECRRPGRGMTLQGSTPELYERWLRCAIEFAVQNPVYGESLVGINAWNEWGEGAYLEPDVYYGAAYLNATARAVTASPKHSTKSQSKLLLIGHDAYRHGAQYLLYHIAKVMKRRFGLEVHILICGPGPLLEDYKDIAECSVVQKGDHRALSEVLSALSKRGFSRAIANTTVSGWLVPTLKTYGFSVTVLIHELKNLIRDYKLEAEARDIAVSANKIIFPAVEVEASFLGVSGAPKAEVVVRPQGLYKDDFKSYSESKQQARSRLGIAPEAEVVINVGYADARKGFDIFASVARQYCATTPEAMFVWIGDATPEVKHWHLPEAMSGDMEARFKLTGHVTNVEDYYAAADAFLLTSREDPFPSVVLEAFAMGLPVLGFSNTTGASQIIRDYGVLVERTDILNCATELKRVISAPDREKEAWARKRKEFIVKEFDFVDYCFDLLKTFDPDLSKVSVVIPNYNYEAYMEDRLLSVFRQDYPIYETIVLDDCSSDRSVEVINEVAEKYNRDLLFVLNAENSGSVFKQWRKGVGMAKGDFVWIAEADDLAQENLVSGLIGSMGTGDASFAFSDSWQIDTHGKLLGESYKFYMNEENGGAFSKSFSLPGDAFLAKYLSVKNVILNVSSVVWRRQALLDAFDAVGETLFDYRVAGDWRLYAEACASGGSVSYDNRSLNGHRRHAQSVTHALNAKKHYKEIVDMQKLCASKVKLARPEVDAQARHRTHVRKVLGVK